MGTNWKAKLCVVDLEQLESGRIQDSKTELALPEDDKDNEERKEGKGGSGGMGMNIW